MQYKSVESAESSENALLLRHKTLDYFLTVLKLVPNLESTRKLNKASFLLENQQQGSRDTTIDINWLILVALPLRHWLLVIWRFKAVTLRLKKKEKNLQDLKISADSGNSLGTTNPRNRRKVEKAL